MKNNESKSVLPIPSNRSDFEKKYEVDAGEAHGAALGCTMLGGVCAVVLVILAAMLCSCTDNVRARTIGGTMTVNLPPNTRLVNATWKESELWYLYRDAKPGETPETIRFQENSEFGIMEGTVIFKEN